jgi:hypothetical protein
MPVFTTIFEDTFNRANENPLNPTNWISDQGVGTNAMQIISDRAVGQGAFGTQVAWYAGSLPNDQFAQVTVEAWNFVIDGDGVVLYVRGTPGQPYSAYILTATAGPNTNNGHIVVYNVFVGLLFSVPATFALGDTFTLFAQGTTIGAYHNGVLVGSATDSSLTGGLAGMAAQVNPGGGGVTDVGLINFQAGSVANGYPVTGNAGIGGALLSYSGSGSGTTTADSSGNYALTLPNGAYTITPSLANYAFNPTSQNVTVSGSGISGVNFTATPTVYSVPDCRTFGNFPNKPIDVNGTETYTTPSVDSRTDGAPVDSRTNEPVPSASYPQNSRNSGT